MFNNYHYFIVLAEEGNITRAAERLFITHQNLSKYLLNLEESLGVTLFRRKPTFSLTFAGELVLAAFRQAETAEQNLKTRLIDFRQDAVGEIRLGTTEGRLRILMPDIISKFKQDFPNIRLLITSAASPDLRKMLQNGQLDLTVMGIPQDRLTTVNYDIVLWEKLYFVISDNMLKSIFPNEFPTCAEKLKNGVDLRIFMSLPFAMNLPNLNSSILLKRHFTQLGIVPNVVHTSSHPDLHHMMSARDYAVSFCLTMYLPSLLKLNESLTNKLNVFPIKNFSERNPVAICTVKNRLLPYYTIELIKMIKGQCKEYEKYNLDATESVL